MADQPTGRWRRVLVLVVAIGLLVPLVGAAAGIVGQPWIPPQSRIEFQYDDDRSLLVVHGSGSTFDASRVRFERPSGAVIGRWDDGPGGGRVVPGDRARLAVPPDARVYVVWDAPGGLDFVLARWEGPAA